MKLNSLVAWALPVVPLVRSGLGTCQGREKQGQTSGESEGSGLHVAWRWITVYLPLGPRQDLGAACFLAPPRRSL